MIRKYFLSALAIPGLAAVVLLTNDNVQSSASRVTPDPSGSLPAVAAVSAPEDAPLRSEEGSDLKKPDEAAVLPEAGSVRISETDQMPRVYVPAGPFLMGSTDLEAKVKIEGGRAYPEIPQHTVTLDGFWIDKYEVTNGMYEKCVEAGGCEPPFTDSATVYYHYYGNPVYSNYPVMWVSWYQARDYCAWAGRRLPTEAEWEKAARGTDGQKYPWGNEPVSGERANFCDAGCPRSFANPAYHDGYADAAPVGSYPAGASPYGAMDMAGNVSEWTSTLLRPYPYDAGDGREDMYAAGERVWRSSPWSNGFWWLRASMRYHSVPTYQRNVLGFRCAAAE